MKRDRNVLCALVGALTLLVALLYGSTHGARGGQAAIARSKASPQLLVAVAARAVRARLPSSGASLDCDRRAPAEHGGGSDSDCRALPSSLFAFETLSPLEQSCSVGRARAHAPRGAAAMRRAGARAPPV